MPQVNDGRDPARRTLIILACLTGVLMIIAAGSVLVAVWPRNPLSVIFGLLGILIVIGVIWLGVRRTGRSRNKQ